MKKRIQKYLAGEREGFSLVELIIVIAIMAILIGVIALAVIPNIQRSRESKDLSTLDSILSGLNVSVANTKLGDEISTATDINTVLAGTASGIDSNFMKEVQTNLGTQEQSLSSTAASKNSAKIYFTVKKSGASGDGKMVITVWAGTTSAANPTDYDSNEATQFQVQN